MNIYRSLLFNFILFFPTFVASAEIVAMVPSDVYKSYQDFLKERDPLSIVDYTGEQSRRDVVEMIYFQQALNKGGINDTIKFVIANSYIRILNSVSSGNVAMSATSMWLKDIKEHENQLYISLPVIDVGDFEAGFYTSGKNIKAMSATSLADIQKLSAVSSKQWIIDWQTLSKLKLKSLMHTISWPSMNKMVNSHRADFLLAPFQNTPDLSLEVEGIKLVPIPNLKIGLEESRHFIISKSYPNGPIIAKAFEKGMKILKDNGRIKKAYAESGFFNASVKDWVKVN